MAARYGLPASAGVHPHEARIADAAVYDELRGLAQDRRIVAIGEIGLDFHYDLSPRDVQREVFRRQIRLAREVGLPVIVHTREADDETAAILEQERAAEAGGVIHCFTGGLDLARRALALGFLISFSGIVAFARAEVIQQVARETPARPAAGGDGRALSRPSAAPGQAQRAGVRRRGGAPGGVSAWRERRGARRGDAPQLRAAVREARLSRGTADV